MNDTTQKANTTDGVQYGYKPDSEIETHSDTYPVNETKVPADWNIRATLTPVIEKVEQHPVFTEFESLDDVAVFLEHYVYAVWDFKVLVEGFRNPQEDPNPFPGNWRGFPPAEDKDWIDEMAHFETNSSKSGPTLWPYHSVFFDSMEALGASNQPILNLITLLDEGWDLNNALDRVAIPPESERHLRTTWSIIETGELPRIVGALAIARRDIIPSEFASRAKEIHPDSFTLSDVPFTDLRRGMELDRVEHVERILTDPRLPEEWEDEAEEGAKEMLEARLNLLDGIRDKVQKNDPSTRLRPWGGEA